MIPGWLRAAVWYLRYRAFRPHRPIGYMCRVDFSYELGAALGGNMIYPSIEDLRQHRCCVDDCGIVEVEVRLRRVVEPGRDE